MARSRFLPGARRDPAVRELAMLADHTALHSVEEYAVLGGILLAGIGYAVGQWRRGKDDARSSAAQAIESTLGIANDELAVLRAARDRLSGELVEVRGAVHRLEGIVEQLQNENRALRELVMLEAVPPALSSFLEGVAEGAIERARALHDETRTVILAQLEAAEHRIAALRASS